VFDHPEYAHLIGLSGDTEAAGLDLFIGEPGCSGRGLGPRIIEEFLRDIVFARPGIEYCLVGPSPDNGRAIRAYEKVGFRHVATVCVSENEIEYLMRIDRSQVG